MWRELVGRLYAVHRFNVGASEPALAEAERALAHRLPLDLRGLLSESDGVLGEYGLGLIWPTRRIVADNLMFRTNPDFRELYMPFNSLLFFADAGNGDQFAFRLVSELWDHDVFAWDHEDDSRRWVAPDLSRYLEWWAKGRIKL